MSVPTVSVLRAAALLVLATVSAVGCGRTTRETVMSSSALKVVAVTESRLDITISEYRKYTTYRLYVDGKELADTGFAALLDDPEAGSEQFTHSGAVVLDNASVLLSSHGRDGRRCWITRLSDAGGKVTLQPILHGSIDCSLRPTAPGWTSFYDEPGNLSLVRAQPFHVHPIAGYWDVLWIEGDVAALYRRDRNDAQLIVRLTRISSDTELAQQTLPMQQYAEPDLLHATPEAKKQWLFDNFSVSMSAAAPSIALRPDNTLATITPEVWAEYQQNDQENREADARARAAGEARLEAQRKELMEYEAARQRTGD